jgi:hypothetical protein
MLSPEFQEFLKAQELIAIKDIKVKLDKNEDCLGILVYDDGQNDVLECWDCGDPLIVHLEKIEDNRVFFHVVGSSVFRSVPEHWIAGMFLVGMEGGHNYACLTPPWVSEYECR